MAGPAKVRWVAMLMTMALLAPLPFGGGWDVVPPAKAVSEPGPVFWDVGNLTVRWGPNAVDSGLVEFLEKRTPPRARAVHAHAQGVLHGAGTDAEKTAAAWAATNFTGAKVEELASWIASDSHELLVRDAFTQSTGRSWSLNNARSYTRSSLPINPVFEGVETLYATLGLTLGANEEIELANSIAHLSPLAQELLAVLIFAVADATKEVDKAPGATTPSFETLAADSLLVTETLNTVAFSSVAGQNYVEIDVQPDSVTALSAAVANLTSYRSIRTAQAAIFMLQATNEVVADLQTLSPPLTRPTSTNCPTYLDIVPLFSDPKCLIIFETSTPVTLTCGPNVVPTQVLIVTGTQQDTFDCPVAATVGGANLLVDAGGDNVYRWTAQDGAPIRNLWAFGAAAHGAAVLYDVSACPYFSGRTLAGGMGAGFLGTGILVAGAAGDCVNRSRMDVIGEGTVQGAGNALGIGILDYMGNGEIVLERYGWDSRCVTEGVRMCPQESNLLDKGVWFVSWGRQGLGAGILGSAGIVRSSSPSTLLRNSFSAGGGCPNVADWEADYAFSASIGLGIGLAGLGAVVGAHDGGTFRTFSRLCSVNPFYWGELPIFTQGMGSLYGLGIVSGNGHEVIERSVTDNNGFLEHALGLGVGYAGGVGAVIDASEYGEYRICHGAGEPDPETGLAPCGGHAPKLVGGGIGAAFGIGLFQHTGLNGGGDNSYTCHEFQRQCFGGIAKHDNQEALCWFDPLFCSLLKYFETVFALGLFQDHEGADVYVGGAEGIGNDRLGYIRDAQAPRINGLFLDCSSSAECSPESGGFEQ